jgi:hypothetical protein
MASFKLDFRPRVDDWDSHRPTITRLYVDEKRTLQEVMDIMQRDYHFSKRFAYQVYICPELESDS